MASAALSNSKLIEDLTTYVRFSARRLSKNDRSMPTLRDAYGEYSFDIEKFKVQKFGTVYVHTPYGNTIVASFISQILVPPVQVLIR